MFFCAFFFYMCTIGSPAHIKPIVKLKAHARWRISSVIEEIAAALLRIKRTKFRVFSMFLA